MHENSNQSVKYQCKLSYGLGKMYSIEYPGYSIECIFPSLFIIRIFILKLYIHVKGISNESAGTFFKILILATILT